MSSDLHHLAAAYALDALEPTERREFEAHYPTCEICASEVVEFRETAAQLAGDVAVAPPSRLKTSVMDEIRATRQESPIDAVGSELRRFGWQTPLLLAAAAAIVLLAGALLFTSPDSLDSDELVSAPDAVLTTLESPTGDPGLLQVVWSAERNQVAILGTGVRDLDPTLTYELWGLRGDRASPAGLFRPRDGEVRLVLDVDDLDPDAWGVTVEPAEGSDQPTTAVIFSGSV